MKLCSYLIIYCAFLGFLVGCERSDDNYSVNPSQSHMYVTYERFEIDRFCSAWLIKKYIDPEACFVFIPLEEDYELYDGLSFDVPGGHWSRGGTLSVSEQILFEIGCEDSKLQEIVESVKRIEIAFWALQDGSKDMLFYEDLVEEFNKGDNFKSGFDNVMEKLDYIYENR